MATTFFMVDLGGTYPLGTHKCSMCPWQFPPTNRAEMTNFELDFTKHHVGEKFEAHVRRDHSPNPEFREPAIGNVVRAPGVHGISKEQYRVFQVDKKNQQAFLNSLDGSVTHSYPVPWAFLSYPKAPPSANW